MTPSRIKPTTSRIVAQCLNPLRHHVSILPVLYDQKYSAPWISFPHLPAPYILPSLSSLRGLAGIVWKSSEPKVFPVSPSPSQQKWCLLITSNPFNIPFFLYLCRLQNVHNTHSALCKLICNTEVNVFSSDCVRTANTENVTINSRGLVSLPQYRECDDK